MPPDPRHDARRNAPAALRNRDPILDVLRAHLSPGGSILEIASGSGQHVIHFAAALTDHIFHPSDPDETARASIDAWISDSGLPNVRPALALDAAATQWPIAAADAVLCINMIHISPSASACGLFQGAAKILPRGGLLYLYGPYKRGGVHTAPSNADFDASLRMQNPDWGVRDLEAVETLARDNGFGPPDIVAMPANNLSLLFRLERELAR
jgi:cyclopropane fatty-acyl-phospholipid synthase-like methyltransferase